jgi:uncharacterized protein (DUF1499 family)
MTVIFERRSSASAIWARRLAFFSALLLVTSSAGHRFALVDAVPFFWLLGIVVGLALVSLLLAGISLFRLWEYGERGGRASTRAVLVVLLVLLPFGIGVYRLFTLPQLTEISTDTLDPPAHTGTPANRSAGMNPIASISREDAGQQAAFYPYVTGRRYPLAVDRAHEIVLAVLRKLGWRTVHDPRMELELHEITIEAEAPSLILGLVSDVAIRIVDEGETSYLDIRSVSRYGRHDLGDNAIKIDRFFSTVEAEILARNAPVVQPAE